MYNTKLVKPEELLNSVFALTDPRWKNKIAMATTRNESVIAWVTALRLTKGDAFTKEYLLKLKANGIVTLNGHTDVRKAVGRGSSLWGWSITITITWSCATARPSA
jgi:iron(III) transport system substrate-binding protein